MPCYPAFKLKKDTIKRLEKEFKRFQNARKIVHENIINYAADYRQFNGTPQDRREFLEREYLPRDPNLNSLFFDENENILWYVEDIVIVTGLSQPSVSRILSKMEKSQKWLPNLLAVQVDVKSKNNNLIHAYYEEIFDLIIDYQEAKYLERFINPRRGAKNEFDGKEILRYWEYLKIKNQNEKFSINNEVPDEKDEKIPAMKIKDILILIFRKIFTPKNLTVSGLIFAVCFEFVRRFNFLMPVSAVVSGIIFAGSVLLLKLKIFRASLISDVGAAALLSMILWAVSFFSDGIIYTPSGAALILEKNHSITLAPELGRGHKVNFRINSDFYDDIKEIFYRILPEEEFISTGFNDFHYPLLFIEPETQHGLLNIELKYKDTKNKQHGPFKFSFDMDKERFEASKKFIFEQTEWLSVKKLFGKLNIIIDINGASYADDDVVEAVVYGINSENPDRKIKITPENSRIEIDISSVKNFEYVSAYLIFKDGTKSKKIIKK